MSSTPLTLGHNSGAESASELIAEAKRVVVLTGAGISTDSRIPDFRGPKGVWTKNPKAEKMSNIHYYVNDPEVRRLAWQSRLDAPFWSAEPNDGHIALLRLEARSKLNLLVTQNIDGLHHAAGSNPDLIVEIHGTAREVNCLSCDYRAPMQDALDRVRSGESDPKCKNCGGLLKSATVSFGQSLDDDDLERSFQAAQGCDLLLAVGSTLGVRPIAEMVPMAKASGAKILIVNGSETEMDYAADILIRGSISEILPTIL